MTTLLYYTPGQQVTLFQGIVDSNGEPIDGYAPPIVSKLVIPALTLATGYPVNMIHLDTGLYYYQFTLPRGAAAVGSYLAEVTYLNHATGFTSRNLYQIIVTAPFGNYGLTVGVP